MEKFRFHLAHVSILGSMECGKTRNDPFHENSWKNHLKLYQQYAEKFSETAGIEIQSQHWCGNRKLSMEEIDVGQFPNSVDPVINETKSVFN